MLDNGQLYKALDPEALPPYRELPLEPEASPARMLKELADCSDGLSGRTLSELPEDSLCLYSAERPCPIQEALRVLSQGIEEVLKLSSMKTNKADDN